MENIHHEHRPERRPSGNAPTYNDEREAEEEQEGSEISPARSACRRDVLPTPGRLVGRIARITHGASTPGTLPGASSLRNVCTLETEFCVR